MEEKKIEERLEEIENKLESLEEIVLSEEKEFENVGERKEKLASELDLETEKLDYLIDIDYENNKIHILKKVEGNTEKEKQINATLALLTASSYIFNEETIRSQDLKEHLKDLGIGALSNLSNNLSNIREYIRSKGKKRSKNYRYELRPLGKNKGLEIIKGLLNSNKKDK